MCNRPTMRIMRMLCNANKTFETSYEIALMACGTS